MQVLETLKVDDSRAVGRETVKASVPANLWSSNEQFSKVVLDTVLGHPITKHPFISTLELGLVDPTLQKELHLEFGHAFAEVFTDALVQAMFMSLELERSLGPVGKVSARFLLQLNVLDELGFCANVSNAKDYAGNPHLAHYLQFYATMRELGITELEHVNYVPSREAMACRKTFTECYSDYLLLTALLAVSETVFTRFSGPWAQSVGRGTRVNVREGYHSIHVEHDGKFVDDDHAEDTWYLLRQAAVPQRYSEVQAKVAGWLQTWSQFLDHLSDLATQRRQLFPELSSDVRPD